MALRHSVGVTEHGAEPRKHRWTLFVLEDDPPATRPRWFCHCNGAPAPGFATPEEAVAWGLARGRTVVVRTLAPVFYLAGEPPEDWEHEDLELRPWPPSPSERRQIDADYEAAVAAACEEEAARASYEGGRNRWLATHAPDRAGLAPMHECLISISEDDDVGLEFEELGPGGAVCGCRHQETGIYSFGSPEEVIAATTGRPVGDEWVAAVCAALDRERYWRSEGRRSTLLVQAGHGEMFHATAVANRESISMYGLDWRRMQTPGIAGGRQPELAAVFLCESREDAEFFIGMARVPSDIWAVRVDGLWLENGPDGWIVFPDPIGPERLRLAERDIPAGRPAGVRR